MLVPVILYLNSIIAITPKVSFKEDIDFHSKSHSANKLTDKLRKLTEVCCQNLLHIEELQKRPHNKRVKSRSYALGKKVWLNSKYIKTKRNKKLENKFFRAFQVVHIVEKQAYKLELSIKWKIHNIFHVSLLEQDIRKKRQVDNTLPEPEKDLKFEAGENKEYEVKTIIDSMVYSQQANNKIPGFYYLVLWKGYPEKEDIWKPLLVVINL